MRKLLPVGLAVTVTIAAFVAFSGAGASARVEGIPDTAMASGTTPLDSYVKTPDAAYRFEFVQAQDDDGVRASLLRMTSQNWLSEAEVDRTKWEHYLWVYTPRAVKHRTGLLFISGGANDGKIPKPSRDYADIARTTGSVVTELRMVPNQTLTFKNDSFGPRKEDEIISFGGAVS